MKGHCQRDLQHTVPQEVGAKGGRVNLTFRQMI
jgi:hypothetical protein